MQKNKLKEIILISLVSIAVIFFALNSVTYFTRLDLTENKSFTISGATKKLISTLPETIHITYFISDKVRTITPVASEIEDLLHEYAANSKGKIVVSSVDPVVANVTTRAEEIGIASQQIQVYEQNEQTFANVYSGIAIQYLDKYETIPFTISLEPLEYDITSRIRKLVEDIEVTVGLLLGDSQKTLENSYTYLADILNRNYIVEVINRGAEIPSSISVLAIIGNKDLTEDDMIHVDEYIMNGGRAIFAVDGVDINMMQNFAAVKLESSPALNLLEKYGVKVNNDLVLDKSAKRIPIQGMFPMMYPQWISIIGQNVSKENPVTARFSGLDLLWASSLELMPEAESAEGVTYEKLLSTTDQAWIMSDQITAEPYAVNTEMQYEGDKQKQVTVGYLITGKLKSAFSDKTAENARVLVIGDSDFAADVIQYSDSPYNINFFENTAEWLSNDESLLQIKTRSRRDMRLNKIESPEDRVSAILFIYIVNIVLVPLAVIVYAVVRGVRRKKGGY